MFVKICGLREPVDVVAAVEAGVDAVGFVLSPSPRRIDAQRAYELAGLVPDSVLTMAVFQNAPIAEIADVATSAGVGAVQLHGDYRPTDFAELRRLPLQLVRAASASGGHSLRCGDYGEDFLVVDSPRPGSGESWDWRAGAISAQGRWMLAGGLRPDNVAEAIESLAPWGVDVSSGVERSRGVKDPALIRRFVSAAKACTAPPVGQAYAG